VAALIGSAVARAQGMAEVPLPWPQGLQSVRWEVMRAGRSRALDVSSFELGSLTRERVIVVRDVTQEEVEQAARSQFLATAAHELRTPMGSICGFTELLLMRNYSPEQARPLLETILRQSMRLSAMLNDLLDLSQMDVMGGHAFSVSPVRLNDAVHKAVGVAVPPGSGRSIEVVSGTDEAAVMAHPQKLEQVLINLISNAVKYSPQGGNVTISTCVHGAPARAHIAVSDQGIGLSPEHQARLFTRFFRADPSGPIPGTGLGLVIVKELIERMGGTIAVQSTLGHGSTFTVSLALCETSS
jgi:signal transduction histidine kinase